MKHIQTFDKLPFDKKFIFVSTDYGVKSQVIMKEYKGMKETPDDTTHFKKYINLVRLINGQPFKRNQN